MSTGARCDVVNPHVDLGGHRVPRWHRHAPLPVEALTTWEWIRHPAHCSPFTCLPYRLSHFTYHLSLPTTHCSCLSRITFAATRYPARPPAALAPPRRPPRSPGARCDVVNPHVNLGGHRVPRWHRHAPLPVEALTTWEWIRHLAHCSPFTCLPYRLSPFTYHLSLPTTHCSPP